MRVHYGEGVAIRIGPEPCVGTREGVGEASVGERIGQLWSRESKIVSGADVVGDPGMCGRSLCGNREISGSASGGILLVRIGKARSRSR